MCLIDRLPATYLCPSSPRRWASQAGAQLLRRRRGAAGEEAGRRRTTSLPVDILYVHM